MPFSRDGLWSLPTEKDIDSFRNDLVKTNDQPKQAQRINAPPEVLRALVSGVESAKLARSQLDTFRTISKLQGPADLVIPVYGGLHVLKECLKSVFERTYWDFELYLVDDASTDPEVHKYLKKLQDEGKAHVLFNKKNRGFAATVNRGVKAGTNPYVIVLNSDIIVTEGWLTKLLMALEADPKNQIVNPVTNNTAMINVNMYPGKSYLDMDAALNRNRSLNYPETMPTGFCLGFRRSIFEEVGPLDETYGSYGEETDFWFKTIKATDEEGTIKGYRAVLCDNAYVFHERGTSFSALGEASHLKQRRSGSERFHQLHPDFAEWSKGYDVDGAVGGLRTQIPPAAFERKYKGNIAWLVKSAGPCGGMNFIADIVNKLIEDGYNAKVCVLVDPSNANTQQMVVSTLHCAPIIFSDPTTFLKEFGKKVFTSGKVLSAVTELTQAAKSLQDEYIGITAYNHVQSWDVELAELVNRPDMVPSIKESYKALPNIVSSNWVAKEIKKIGGQIEFITVPGVNSDLFHPRDRELGDERFTVGILMDNTYFYKGYKKGVEFCKILHEKFKAINKELRILVIGAPSIPECPYVVCKGQVSQSAMAQLMANEIDVFVDPAQCHSYGLPSLEALFSGALAVTFGNKGEAEYSNLFKDRLFVNADLEKCADWIAAESGYCLLREESPVDDILVREENVRQFIHNLFPKVISKFKSRIEVVTPHLRKHGGPTTNITMANQLQNLGHDVTMSMTYTDWNPEVFNMAEIPLRTRWRKVPSDAKVIIINSDNPFAKEIMELNPDKKYIMYKLSHNDRFKQSENNNLNLPWNHIMTSTNWLRDVCINPKETWTHKAWDPEKVTVIGWYHYGHPIFNCPPQNRTYGDSNLGFRMGVLLHEHALKGTNISIGVSEALKKKWEANAHIVGFGEVKAKVPGYFQFFRSPPRHEMAYVMKQLDVWFGASYTEGLGRIALEAMSAGVCVVSTDTGAEFLKDGENCLLYPVGDAQRGAELVHALVQNRDLIQKLAINGYKTAMDAANPEPFKKNLNKVIEEVLRGDN